MTDAAGFVTCALLREAERYGVGLTVEPDFDAHGLPDGWTIGYITPNGGGVLAEAYDLLTALTAAVKPLRRIGESLT